MVGRTARPDSPGRAVSLGWYAALLCLGLMAPTPTKAQETFLAGRLVDAESGEPVVSGTVRVVFWGGGPGQAPQARTDVGGGFRLQVPPGRYVLAAEGDGYEVRRLDGIRAPQADTSWVIELTPLVARYDPLVTSPDGSRLERVSEGATSASVVGSGAAQEWSAFTHAGLFEGLPGVSTTWTGLQGRAVTMRGIGPFFAGGPLLLEDDRIAHVPSSRMNVFDLISSTLLDVERVELLRGPMSVLYGPNAVGGAIRIVTSSPIDHPGTSASLTAGEREVVHGAVREAVRLGERAGLALSGHYLRGREWEVLDPQEATAGTPYTESGGARVRLDVRPWSDGEIGFSAGLSRMSGSMLLMREGPVQATDWTQGYGEARFRKGSLSAQGFMTLGDAGSSVSLPTGTPIVDRSNFLGGRAQYRRTVNAWIDAFGGVDVTRTNPVTDGTIHGVWEDADGVTEAGAYAYGVATPSERTRIEGALRVDWHNHLEGVRLSPRLAVNYEALPGQTLRVAFNRGYTDPTPDRLFADRVTGSVPLLDSLAFDIRVVGRPDRALTFDRRCAGGVDDRCMFSPFLPGIRMPATGAALWDAVLVPLALESEELRATLAVMGISPNAFAQIIGRPGPSDLNSRLVNWIGGDPDAAFEPASPPSTVARLRPATTESLELGLRGTAGSRLSYSADLYATRVSDLVGPPEVATPTLYLESSSVDAFLLRRMLAVGIPPGVADRIAQDLAAAAVEIPLGTLAPDQRENADVVLAYRNLGAVTFWGADLGARVEVTPQVSLLGSLSYLSQDCFDLDADGACGTAGDVTLNAPTLGAGATLRWSEPVLGITLEGRVRHAGGYPVSTGPYRGTVDPHTLLDVSGRFLVRWAPGATISVAVTNVLDSAHRDFIGAPEIGRLAVATLHYAF